MNNPMLLALMGLVICILALLVLSTSPWRTKTYTEKITLILITVTGLIPLVLGMTILYLK